MSKKTAASPFSVGQCTFSFHLEPLALYLEGTDRITVTISHPKRGQIGHIDAWTIDRTAMGCWGISLLATLEKALPLMRQTYMYLFDRNGNIKGEFLKDEWRRGLGVWGRELNDGLLVYVGAPFVKAKYACRAVEVALMRAFMGCAHVKKADFFLSSLSSKYGLSTCEKTDEVPLLRLNGFRRVGRSNVFAYAAAASHPSRLVTIHADLDEAPLETDVDFSKLGRGPVAAADLTRQDYRKLFPARSSILDERLTFSAEQRAQAIRDLHLNDPLSIHQRDLLGFTPLHIAIEVKNVAVVRKLLALGADSDIDRRDNQFKASALDFCRYWMHKTRDFRAQLYEQYSEIEEEYLRIEYLILRAKGYRDLPGTEEEHVKLKRWGCTCGKCVDGWISPRMSARLMDAATVLVHIPTIPDAFFRNPVQDRYDANVAFVDETVRFIPFNLRYNMSLSVYRGYRTVLNAVCQALLAFGETQAITSTALLETLPADWETDDVLAYKAHGGIVDFACDCVMYWVMEHGPFGTRMFEVFTRLSGEQWGALAQCANDLEFEMVRWNMAPEIAKQPAPLWGPHIDPAGKSNTIYMDEPQYSLPILGMSSRTQCIKCVKNDIKLNLRSSGSLIPS